MNSCLYEGWVAHRRTTPVENAFRYALYMVSLDLDELDQVFRKRWLWSTRRPAVAWFRRRDHLGDPAVPLADAVRDLVEASGRARPTGPIHLLTNLRMFGYYINPVSFYYCYDAGGEKIETIVAEVQNTPWGERHCYVLRTDEGVVADAQWRFRLDKAFHVSPFMAMDQQYEWSFGAPESQLSVHMRTCEDGRQLLDATLALRREPITRRSLARVLVRYPFITAKVAYAIYFQAFRLWTKRVPFHSHPKHRVNLETPSS